MIVVVGGGVIGLTCAYQLADKGYKVTVVAQHLPNTSLDDSQYTSPWAGAHFRPFPSKNEAEARDFKLTRATYKAFKVLSAAHPESSIEFMEGIDYIESRDPLYEQLKPGYKEEMDDFQVIKHTELPSGISFGAKYNTWCLNSPMYLQFLQRRLEMHFGVEFHKASFGSLKQVSDTFPGNLIVNCTGRGLTYQGGYDPTTFPIRGQTLLVRKPLNSTFNKTVTYQLADGSWCFAIPRPLDGGVILGGTKQVGSVDGRVSAQDTEKLKKNARRYFPELMVNGQFEVTKVNVGFRPAREGGVRIEKELVHGCEIVHCYGFGGSGYEMSWGAAERVVELVERGRSKL